jgi:hypothetical protein
LEAEDIAASIFAFYSLECNQVRGEIPEIITKEFNPTKPLFDKQRPIQRIAVHFSQRFGLTVWAALEGH